ncbi:MAG: MarR family transcriptional regulator [Pseudomonadota bacterium]
MPTQAERTRLATATVLRVLKIMEPEVPTAHDRFRSNPSDIAALHFIGDNPGCQSKALAKTLGVAATTISSLTDRLVNSGLARRERPAADRRSIALFLTDEGEAARAQIIIEERETAKRMLDALPRDQRETFVSNMETIAQILARDADLE